MYFASVSYTNNIPPVCHEWFFSYHYHSSHVSKSSFLNVPHWFNNFVLNCFRSKTAVLRSISKNNEVYKRTSLAFVLAFFALPLRISLHKKHEFPEYVSGTEQSVVYKHQKFQKKFENTPNLKRRSSSQVMTIYNGSGELAAFHMLRFLDHFIIDFWTINAPHEFLER